MVIRLLAVAIGALIGFPAAAQGAPERADVRIAVGGKAALAYLPLTIAERLGYFGAEGLDARISDFAGGTDALRAVIGGSADVASGAYEHTVAMQAKHQQLQCFVLQGRLPQISIGIATSKAAGYRSPKDLKGMRVGVSAPGSTNNMVVNFFIAREGLKPSDISIIGVGNSAGAVAAMKTGRVDAMANSDPVMTRLELDGDIKTIADVRTLKGSGEIFGGPMPAACLYAPIEFIRRYPNTVQALANAIVRADKWIQAASPQEVLKTVPEAYSLGDKALYLSALANVKEAFSPDGLMPETGPGTTLRALSAFNPGVNPERIRLELTYTNEFAAKANRKYP